MWAVNNIAKTIIRLQIIFIVAVALFFAGTASAQTKPDTVNLAKTEIVQLEQKRIQALITGDYATQESLMAPECIHIESSGIQRTTAEYIASLRNRKITFDVFIIDEAQVRFYGPVAIVTGSYHDAVHGMLKQPVKYARYTRVWAKGTDEQWRLVSHQATEMPAQEVHPNLNK